MRKRHSAVATVRPAKHTADMEPWKLEDAKARFSELVRLAGTHGPQLITVRGKRAAVILSTEDYESLLPATEAPTPLVGFLQSLGLDEIDLEREHDTGREIGL